MMINSIRFFIIIFQLISFSIANSSVDDKMLIAFVGNDQKMPISEYSKQKYEAHLGILYFMKNIWQCDEIPDEFEEYERTECQKYRKYLDILYEYLYKEYVGIPAVKPKFVFKNRIEIEGPIIYAVKCLAKISQFYFCRGQFNGYKLSQFFIDEFVPKLLNEERLNYEQKLPFNEMILQLAIDTANEWQTNESLEEIVQENFRKKFEKNLEQMFNKAEEKEKEDNPMQVDQINDDKHWIILSTEFADERTWNEDALFSEFVKGLATNFEKFFKMAEEYSVYLSRNKVKRKFNEYDGPMISSGLYKIEKMKKHLTHKHEAHLGFIYLMKGNWHCEKFSNKLNKYGLNERQKHRKYLDILYEYLFRLYAEAKNLKVSKQMAPLVKPIFIDYVPLSLIEYVKILKYYSRLFWEKYENAHREIKLVNEEELNFAIKERENDKKDENLLSKWKQNVMEKITGKKHVKKGKEILNGGPTDSKMKEKGQKSLDKNVIEIANLWEEFEKKMEKMYENAKEGDYLFYEYL